MSELNRVWQCGTSLKQAMTQGFRRSGRVLALGERSTSLLVPLFDLTYLAQLS